MTPSRPDSWTVLRDRYRRPQPSAWSRLVAWGDGFMEAHPRLGMACSAGAVCGFVAFAFQAAALLSGVR